MSSVSAAEKRTPPVVDVSTGSSVTVSTAAKPTPKRPTVPPSRLADARSVASASTPAASSGAPVFAARSSPSTRDSRSSPGTPARAAASEAFWASSTSRRSRYAPWTRSSSALASSRNRAGDAAHPATTRSRTAAVPNGSVSGGALTAQLCPRDSASSVASVASASPAGAGSGAATCGSISSTVSS